MDLPQLVRFLIVKLTYSNLNFIFNICIIFMGNYYFSERRYLHRQRDVLGDRFRESSRLNLLNVFIGVGCICVCS
jgi:hypothetical protein